MRRFIPAAILVGAFFSVAPMAQAKDIQKGTIALSGATGLNFTWGTDTYSASGMADEDDDTSNLDLFVDGVYYVMPNLGVGLAWNYQNSSSDFAGGESESTFTTFGPVVEYNLSISDPLNAFFRGSFGLASLNSTYDEPGYSDELDGSGWYFRFGGGLRYFVIPSVSLDGSLSYTSATLDLDYSETGFADFSMDLERSEFDLALGLSVFF